jgi:hypothetical protein
LGASRIAAIAQLEPPREHKQRRHAEEHEQAECRLEMHEQDHDDDGGDRIRYQEDEAEAHEPSDRRQIGRRA